MVQSQNKPLGYKSLTECVVAYLKQQLIDGDLKAGDEINLTSLCGTLGVSRTPVREALVQLIKDGFIEEATRKGFRIKKLSLLEIRDIYLIGGLLESEVVKIACERMSDEDISRCEALLDASEAALSNGDDATYAANNSQFNELLRSFCPNALLINYVNPMAMNCWYVDRISAIKCVGLCHSVQHTSEWLALMMALLTARSHSNAPE